MTEKDKDEMQRAMTSAWELRDDIREAGDAIRALIWTAAAHQSGCFTGGLTLERVRNLEAKATKLVVELAQLSATGIQAITVLETSVRVLREDLEAKLETIEHDHSSLEDEVAALQEEVSTLKSEDEP